MEFLSNYLPGEIVQTLPNLPFRRAIAVGKAIRGSVPLIFDVPELKAPKLDLRHQENKPT